MTTIRVLSLEHDDLPDLSPALAGFAIDPSIPADHPRAVALADAVAGARRVWLFRFPDDRWGAIGVGHPDTPVAIETVAPSKSDRFNSAQAAIRTGLSITRLREVARELGVGRREGRDWRFTVADLAAIRTRPRGPVGRPKKSQQISSCCL